MFSFPTKIGLVLIGLAFCVAFMPFQMPFRPGGDPSTQLYRAAKGSMIPAAQANSEAAGMFKFAAILTASGILLLAFSAARDWLRHTKARKRKALARR